MGKYKIAGKSKPGAKTDAPRANARVLIPCLLLVLGGIALFSLAFYGFLKSAKQ